MCFIPLYLIPTLSWLQFPLLLPSVVNGLWKMLGVERLPCSLGKRGVFPSQGVLLVIVPHTLLNHRKQPLLLNINLFNTGQVKKKEL